MLLACTAVVVPPGPRIVSLHDTTTEIVVGLGRANTLVAILEPAFLSSDALAATMNSAMGRLFCLNASETPASLLSES